MRSWRTVLLLLMPFVLAACANPQAPQGQLPEPGSQVTGVMGGEPVSADQNWARAIVLVLASNGERCTGALIKPDVILTAAHCVEFGEDNVSFTIRFRKAAGANDLVSLESAETREVLAHEDYAAAGNVVINDIALIALKNPAPEGVVPLELAPSVRGLSSRESLLAIGYGKTKDFHIAEPDSDVLHSAPVFAASRIGRDPVPSMTDQSELILVSQKNGKGICSGDSGGPLLRWQEGRYQILGVANFVMNAMVRDRRCSGYSAFRSVVAYQDWIQRSISHLGAKTP